MSTTIYATFTSSDNAERAAGALLDYGVRPEDISIVRKDGGEAAAPAERVDDTAMLGSTGAVGSTGVDQTTGRSAAAYGDAPAISTDRFGADITGMHETTGMHGMSDANGVAGEMQIKRGLDAGPEQNLNTARANDERYDNLASYEHRDGERNGHNPETAAKAGISTTTPADAGAGAVKGAGIGLGVGTLAALASMFVPGFGILVGGGALAAALGGVAATTGAGALAGAVTGYLKDQGMEDHVAAKYEEAVGGGGALIAVAVPSGNIDEHTVRSILDKYGAANVSNYATRGYLS